ncbi:MAG: uroporphyrinogen-III synthase [Burkholderiales bacterium]|jgi:uroporphyrinogen-III synthase
MNSTALAGRRVVVTRPAGQAAHMAALIRAAGGEALLFPALEIFDTAESPQLRALIEHLETFDLAIFISANAVSKALALVRARRDWPPALRVATVGRGSERELQRHGFAAVIAPGERFDSEGLLELPELQQLAGKRVVIFRGAGGRELLGDTLTARGAAVEYAECYRRGRPNADPAPLLARCARRELDAITVTSSEGLANLHAMLGEAGRQCLQGTPLFAPHERIAAAARALGVRTVVLTGPGDAGLVAGLAGFFAKV